jgi:hypothetical protein
VICKVKRTGHRAYRCPVLINAKWIFGTCAAVLLLCSLISFNVLEIDAIRKEHVVFVHIIHPGDTFATRYTHSVELCHVWEFFRIDEQYRIVLYETTFSSCNTGLPVSLAGNEKLHHEGDHFRVSDMHRVVSGLSLWVHEKYGNMLKIGDAEAIRLSLLAGNTLLKVTIRNITFPEYIYLKAKTLLPHFTQ